MLDSDIKTYHASEVSSNPTNGGRRSYNEVISGVVNNVWPHVTKAERLAGSELNRFLYTLVADSNDGTLLSAEEFLDNQTAGEDYIVAFVMPYGSTQSDITGSEEKFGTGQLNADVSAAPGPVTFAVDVEDVSLATGTDAIFRVGGSVRITDKLTPDAVLGNEQTLTITSVTNVDTLVTITVSEDLAATYTVAAGSRVSSMMLVGDTKTASSNYVVTSASGVYDFTTYPLILDNIGTEEDSLTYTFTDATNFTCTGTSGIAYGSGDVGIDFTPVNPNTGTKYHTLEAAGTSGTFAGGDTITVDVAEASFLACYRRTVPINCASLANNMLTSVKTGESAV